MRELHLTFWVPTVVKDVGFTDPIILGLIDALAYLCGAAGMVAFTCHGARLCTIAATAPPPFAQPAKEPKLTLYVLAVYSGKPAAKVRVDLSVLAGENYQRRKSVNTTASGRNEQSLLAGQEIKVAGISHPASGHPVNPGLSSLAPSALRGGPIGPYDRP